MAQSSWARTTSARTLDCGDYCDTSAIVDAQPLFGLLTTADSNIHECAVKGLASGDCGGRLQTLVHFLSASQRFLYVCTDVLGTDEVRKFSLLDES